MPNLEPSPDVIVIGGGIVGCACAWELARAGAKVLLLERDRVGSGASAGATGMVWPSGALEGRDAWFELLLAASNDYAETAARLYAETGLEVEYRQTGMLRVALDEAERARWQAAAGWMSEAGLPAEWLEPEAALKLEPRLAPDLAGALWLPGAAQVRSWRVTAALASAAALRGAEIREMCPVLALERRGERLASVRTHAGSLSAERVVLAAGAWSGQLTLGLPAPLPVSPVKGQVVTAEAPYAWLRRMVSATGISVTPRADGRLTISSTEEEAGFDTRPTLDAIAQLTRAGARLVPGLEQLALHEAWAGLRPAAPGRRPIIGPVEGCQGLFAATAHFRSGILLAPLTGRVVAELLLGNASAPSTAARLFEAAGALAPLALTAPSELHHN